MLILLLVIPLVSLLVLVIPLVRFRVAARMRDTSCLPRFHQNAPDHEHA